MVPEAPFEPGPPGFPWTKVAYGLTAAWMIAVIAITGNNVTHPLFDYIFTVPLAAWIGGLVVARLVKARRKP